MSNKRKQPWTAKRIRNVIDHIHNEQFAAMKKTIHLRAFSSFYKHNDEFGNDLRFVTAIVKSSDDRLKLKTEAEIRRAYQMLTDMETNDERILRDRYI